MGEKKDEEMTFGFAIRLVGVSKKKKKKKESNRDNCKGGIRISVCYPNR